MSMDHTVFVHLVEQDSFVILQEHLIGLSEEGPEDTPLDKDQARISRLEKQAEEFLNAVLCRKGEYG